MPEGAERRPLMTEDQLRQLPAWDITVGSHSLTHARLPDLDAAALSRELGDSRARLADILGQSVDLLAYPYGLYDERVIRHARAAGYLGACSTRSGFNADGVEPLALRRIDVYGTDRPHAFRRKLDFGINDWSLGHEIRYLAGRIGERLTPLGRQRRAK